jgi:hypothetical protein
MLEIKTEPRRIQRKRTRGWRAPEGAVNVTRPGKFGNPITLDMISPDIDRNTAQKILVREFENWLNGSDAWVNDAPRRRRLLDDLCELRGKTLMCFCAEGDPCHGDVLLRMANAGSAR